MKKPYDEILMKKLINQVNEYLSKIEELLCQTDKRLYQKEKKAA